jgi:predicted nucleic acid-binding protein
VALAYVDTSCLIAIVFGEKGASNLARRLERFDDLLSSNLLEAEFRSALVREGIGEDPAILSAISWVIPDRPLSREIASVLSTGYLKGADCWHLATALYVADDAAALSFLTLDSRQRTVAKALGFAD